MDKSNEQNNKYQSFQNLPEGDLKNFYEFHGIQLLANGFPPSVKLLESLYEKLQKQVYNSGNYFQILDNPSEHSFSVITLQDIKAESEVFIIDHAVSFRYEELRPLLESNPQLVKRLQYMLQYWNKKITIPKISPIEKTFGEIVELDYKNIVDPLTQTIKQDCIALSLFGNKIDDIKLVKQMLTEHPKVRVLWLNENPVSENQELKQMVESEFPNIELFNSQFTRNATSWAFLFVTFKQNLDKVNSAQLNKVKYLNLSGRNVLSLKSLEIFKSFSNLHTLNLTNNQFKDQNEIKQLLHIIELLPNLKEIEVDWNTEMILFDLYKKLEFSKQLFSVQYVNGHDIQIGLPAKENEFEIAHIIKNVWKLTNCYRLASDEKLDEQAIFYMMDELGSCIQHSDTANVRVVPFLFAPNNKMDNQVISYSLLWPCKDLQANQAIYRDYFFNITEQQFRSSRLFVYFDVPAQYFLDQYETIQQQYQQLQKKAQELVEMDTLSKKNFQQIQLVIPKKDSYKLYCDYDLVWTNLQGNSTFQRCDTVQEADIIYTYESLTNDANFKKLSEHQLLNQFPYESCIVQKQNLAKTVQLTFGNVKWLQPTYNLETELPAFIGEYLKRQENFENNIWIIKPPNLARSMDMVVTDNIDAIIKHVETGPKLAQKYIENPVTIKNRKTDLRFIVAVRSIDPIDVMLYKTFWIRISNNDFTNDYRTREIYETHFTVMNYGRKLEQIHYYEYIEMFNQEYKSSNITWNDVYPKIKEMVRQLFIAVKQQYPQMQNIKSRSIYGMDIMIEKGTFQPKLLEMTFSPDCGRACKYTKTFMNDIISSLFLHKPNEECNMDQI